MKKDNGNNTESDIDKLIRELQLEEVNTDDDIELEFDEIVYVEDENNSGQSGDGNKGNKNKFDKIMNIILSIGGAVIVILLVLIIVGKSSAGNLTTESTETEGKTIYVDDETATFDIDRPDNLDKATADNEATTEEETRPTETMTTQPTTQEPTQESTEEETTTQEQTTKETTTDSNE